MNMGIVVVAHVLITMIDRSAAKPIFYSAVKTTIFVSCRYLHSVENTGASLDKITLCIINIFVEEQYI